MYLSRDFTEEMGLLKDRLGVDTAIISCIVDTDYEVLAVVSKISAVKPGDVFETCNTYCNEVVKHQQMVMYDRVGTDEAMVLHPVYTAMQLEAYIAEPLRKDGKIVGTLNFSGFMPKDPNFSRSEIDAVKALARKVEAALV
jgi:GAF domain-containing protein